MGGATFWVDISDEPEERTQGLSFRDSLAEHAGMWFVMDSEVIQTFWMREMRFPIDIIWIDSDLVVVGVEHEAPHPPPDAEPSELPLYSSPSPALYVLEVNAGLAREYGIGPGIEVTFEDLR